MHSFKLILGCNSETQAKRLLNKLETSFKDNGCDYKIKPKNNITSLHGPWSNYPFNYDIEMDLKKNHYDTSNIYALLSKTQNDYKSINDYEFEIVYT